MWECPKCHVQNEETAGYCYHCKAATKANDAETSVAPTTGVVKDAFLVLSLFIPIVGVILYCMNVRTSKKVAEAYLTWSVMMLCIVAYIAIVVYTGIQLGAVPALAALLGIGGAFGATVSVIGGSKVAKHVLFALILATYAVLMYATWITYGTYAGIIFGIGVGVLVECILMALLGGERVLYILSFLVPPVGFVVYAMKRDSAPAVAKNCLSWMAIAFSAIGQIAGIAMAFSLLA